MITAPEPGLLMTNRKFSFVSTVESSMMGMLMVSELVPALKVSVPVVLV